MRKVYILIIGLLLVFEHRAHAQVGTRRLSNQSTPEIKFGPYASGGWGLSWSSGIFGEYKFNEVVGLRIYPSVFRDVYGLGDLALSSGGGALVRPLYVGSPILVSFYPGEGRQVCLFGGVQVGYLIGGLGSFVSANTTKTQEEIFKQLFEDTLQGTGTPLLEVSEQDKVRKLGLNLMVGSEYHFGFGLILGLSYSYRLMDIIEAKKSSDPAAQLVLGYNFGTFLK